MSRPCGTYPTPSRDLSYTGTCLISAPRYSMLPAWNDVWPMIVARSVVLPTPFLPSTASDPRSASESVMSSRTTVAP